MTDFADMIDGYRRFRATGWAQQRERWDELKDGQSPKVMVIACSDSRVDPSQIFDVSPGEIFVVRNVANLVPPYETGGGRHGVSAALEFAVTQLQVPEVVVMGHASCGGCAAALSGAFEGHQPGEGGFIAHWVDLLDEARDKVRAEHGDGPEAKRELEHEAVRVSLANLRTFPFVTEREAAGTLRLRGAYFAIADGVLHVMDDDGAFAPA
ncbi:MULTISPECIES: carbonic anhydrase [unclassified Sphingomonas]|uniref:carbonic anhydrase n=1 Tax=unclassified Sphingomonas TaxID=196159 RepID=UPI000E1005D0|nr:MULTISPECIES: carbonic anhydrase [unclassified Sphingomonas]AXJ97135.1 carbonic anhydrase [Sphingomonas sp. FARSPH]